MDNTNEKLDQRRAGVLLHMTSLPGAGACGSLGWEALNFVNFLADCGVTVWQMLPVGPPQGSDSPYQTSSAHAGSARLIGLEPLAQRGWLDDALEPDLAGGANADAKGAALRAAHRRFQQVADDAERLAVEAVNRPQAHLAGIDSVALTAVVHSHFLVLISH